MAASVLPVSTAYSIEEAFGWERGIGCKFKEASQFFFLYTLLIVVGAGITVFVPSNRLVFVLNIPNVVGVMLLLILNARMIAVYSAWRSQNLPKRLELRDDSIVRLA
jgi:hypothetical protein